VNCSFGVKEEKREADLSTISNVEVKDRIDISSLTHIS
jgi:hypothetical protein